MASRWLRQQAKGSMLFEALSFQVAHQLLESGGQSLSIIEISHALKVSHQAIPSKLKFLVGLGFAREVESSRGRKSYGVSDPDGLRKRLRVEALRFKQISCQYSGAPLLIEEDLLNKYLEPDDNQVRSS